MRKLFNEIIRRQNDFDNNLEIEIVEQSYNSVQARQDINVIKINGVKFAQYNQYDDNILNLETETHVPKEEFLSNILHADCYICCDCGELLFEDEQYYFDGNYYCECCYDDAVTTCHSCGCEDYCDSDYMRYVDCANAYFCERCINDNFVWCEYGDADEYIDRAIRVFDDRGDEMYAVSGYDFNDIGEPYTECPECGTIIIGDSYSNCPHCNYEIQKPKKDKTGLKIYDKLKSYHPYDVKLTCIDNIRKIIPMNKFKGFGIELEINNDNKTNHLECDKANEYIEEINKYLGGHAYYSRDGSLSHGFEIVTQPHTEKAIHNLKWNDLFTYLKSVGFTDNSIKAGYHIHITRKFFGKTSESQDKNIAKFLYFFEKNKQDLIKMSRREQSQLHWCNFYSDNAVYERNPNSWEGIIRYPSNSETTREKCEFIMDRDRCTTRLRGAVNLGSSTAEPTIEVRLFRSTLDEEAFLGTFDMVATLVKNTNKMSWDDIDDMSKWLDGLSDIGKKYLSNKNVLGFGGNK